MSARLHPLGAIGRFVSTSAVITLFIAAASLIVTGCDASEDQDLLNPPLPDSTLVRVVNLTDESDLDLSFGSAAVVTDLAARTTSSYRPFFSLVPFTLTIRGGGIVDTLPNQSLAQGADSRAYATYVVVRGGEAHQLMTLLTSEDESTDLADVDMARLYFINGDVDADLSMRRGCRSGTLLFDGFPGAPLVGSTDLAAGSYSLFLNDDLTAEELTSAQVTLEPGGIYALLSFEENGTTTLSMLRIDPSDQTTGGLTPVPTQTSTTARLRVLNALETESIDVGLLGGTTPIAADLPSSTLSPGVDVDICLSSAGDTLVIVDESGDTALSPLRSDVGSESTIVVYDVEGEIRSLLLSPQAPPSDANTFAVRSVNLSDVSGRISIVAGAGAPGDLSTGRAIQSGIDRGTVSSTSFLPSGLYPISAEQSNSSELIDGALHRFGEGRYTIFVTSSGDASRIVMMDDDRADEGLLPLDLPGRRALFFSMVPDRLVDFTISTSAGSYRIPAVAYSYVYSTIVPNETIDVAADGIGSESVSVAATDRGWTIGVTGTSGSYDLMTMTHPTSAPPSGKALVRFLNAVPGTGTLDIRLDKFDGPVEASASYGVPTGPLEKDARRFTFSVTNGGTNDEVARISGVVLTSRRGYMLVIGPPGPTSTSGLDYGTLWMQE